MPRAGKAFNLYLSDEERTALESLAASIGRPLHDEIRHAIRRHLAEPPVLQTAVMAPVVMDPPTPTKRGRPRKQAPPQ